MSVFFGGRLITTPTSAAFVVDDAMRNSNPTVGLLPVMVGRAAGGKPKTLMRFGSPAQAIETLGSGELLDAVLAAFDPSTETGGPVTVAAMNVQPSTQATGAVKDASNATVINLTSVEWGASANLVSFKVEAGTTAGTLRLTAKRGTAYFTKDNIERRCFSVRYSGAAASATLTIDATQVVLAAPAGTVVGTILKSSVPTVADLVDRINQVSGFAASSLDGNSAKTTASLDFVAAQDVKTDTYTARANLQACVDWFNGSSKYLTATRAANAGTVPAVTGTTFLTGGTDGTVTYEDWVQAFEALQAVSDAYWITAVSGNANIRALCSAHCAFMSNIGNKERRAINGTDLGTTNDAALAAARELNDDRSSLVFQGHYNYSTSGEWTLFPPYITAAQLSGAFAALAPGNALTNKTLKIRGLEREVRNPTDTDVLIPGGLICIDNTEQGYKVLQSVSTWLGDRKYNRVEQSTGCATDYTKRTVREAVDVLRGSKSDRLLLSRYISVAESTLRELSRPEPQGPGVLVGDEINPPFKNITATLEGDAVRLDFQCSPAIPNNYALTTIYVVPYSGTASA